MRTLATTATGGTLEVPHGEERAMKVREPQFITFTGVDEYTSIDGMIKIADRYPVEWGILFSPSRQGKDPRYPSVEVIEKVLARVHPSLLAAHLCGGHSRRVMKGKQPQVPVDLRAFSRVQVNSHDPDPEMISRFEVEFGLDCIAQARGEAFPDDRSILWLFDQSGGRGEAPAKWPPHPHPHRLVGYAGGIGPHNVLDVIETIDAKAPYWIDMESGVRVDNVLDLGICSEICQKVFGDKMR